MAFSRKQLKAIGLTEEQVETVVDWHTETVNALKEERDTAKADADKLADIQKQLADAQEKLKQADSDGYKKKFEEAQQKFEALEKSTKEEKTRNAKESKMREALKKAGFSENGINKVAKYGGYVDTIELDEKGEIKDADTFLNAAKSEWGEYIGKSENVGAEPANPPANAAGKPKSSIASDMDDIMSRLYGVQKDKKE